MSDEGFRAAFPHLTAQDLEALMGLASSKAFSDGATIITKDSKDRSLMVVRGGIARVEQPQQEAGIAIARLGPGQLLGEIAFVASGGASADVRAEGAVSDAHSVAAHSA